MKKNTMESYTGGQPVGRWTWRGDIMIPMFEQKITPRKSRKGQKK